MELNNSCRKFERIRVDKNATRSHRNHKGNSCDLEYYLKFYLRERLKENLKWKLIHVRDIKV